MMYFCASTKVPNQSISMPLLALLMIAVLSLPGFAQTSQAADDRVALEILEHLTLFREGSIEKATLRWQNLAQNTALVAKPFETELKRLAGLAYVLASYGWDQLNDPRAYGTWQAALEAYLAIDSYWEQEVARQLEQLQAMESDLTSISPQSQTLVTSPVQLGAVILLWQQLEKQLNISQYRGPSAFTGTRPVEVDETTSSRPSAPVPFLVREDDSPSETPTGNPPADPSPLGSPGPVSRALAPEAGEPVPNPSETALTAPAPAEPPTGPPSTSGEAEPYVALSDAFLQAIEDEQVEETSEEKVIVDDPKPLTDLYDETPAPTAPSVGEQPENSEDLTEPEEAYVSAMRAARSGSEPLFGDPESSALPSTQTPPFMGNQTIDLSWRKPSQSPEPLSAADRKAAETAWQYMARNFQTRTGLINAVDGYPFATIWDVASGLAATFCAYQLGIISESSFTAKWRLVLATLEQLPLYEGALPNREYQVQSAQMTDLNNQLSSQGSGWSAIDLGRILSWLAIYKLHIPATGSAIERLVAGWDLERACQDGQLYGAYFDGQTETYRQEGRLGYEQYAAAGFALWDLPVTVAQNLNFDSWVDVEGVVLPVDNRNLNYLTSEPFVLATLEHRALEPEFKRLTELMFLTQKQRYERTGILTAVSEDAISRYPWFVYNCVVFGDQPWMCVDRKGRSKPQLKSFSTKAGWAWSALFVDDYSLSLYDKASSLNDPQKGFFSGAYESGGTNQSLNINTNAVILEAIYYKSRSGLSFLAKAGPP